jgi:peptidoglycan/LPS O-acetylase OafA/YrhL
MARPTRVVGVPTYMPQLDSLRTVAVTAVLLCHLAPRLPAAFSLGIWGVRLFFVLSGFLITGILLRARHNIRGEHGVLTASRHFYLRRFVRIFPVYYLVLALTTLADFADSRRTIFWHLAYLSNLLFVVHPAVNGPFDHLWSLSVEEQFYLIWPWIVLVAPPRVAMKVIVALIVVAPLSRFGGFFLFGRLGAMYPLTSCLDSLGAGALLAYAWERDPAGDVMKRLKPLVIAALLALPAVYALPSTPIASAIHLALRDLVLAVLFCGVIGYAARGFRGPLGAILDWPPVRYLGRISYGIYLYHRLVQWTIAAIVARDRFNLLNPHPWVLFALIVTTTIAVASLSWQFFERPLNDLKARIGT